MQLLICVFVFAYANSWFSYDAAQILQVFEAYLLSDDILMCNTHIDEDDVIKRGETLSSTLFVQFYSDYKLSGIGFELSYAHSAGKI